ncbi:MAG: hypothetical protein M1480_09245 [Bacteroidetes bacterium]|nr:hypothetical protein [Bacteroidota bacterium]
MRESKFYSIFLLVTFAACSEILAQENNFKVLAIKGEILIDSDNTNLWHNLTLGSEITGSEKIKLNNNSYLGLAFSPGGTLELKRPGEYNYSQLMYFINLDHRSVNRKFSDFVFNELTKKIGLIKEMKSAGAVIRLRPNGIPVAVPFSSYTIDSVINFKWHPVSNSSNYIFKLINCSNRTIFMKELSDTSLSVNLNSLYLASDSAYRWYVYDFRNPSISSDTNCIIKYSQNKIESIKDSLIELNKTLGSEPSALNQVIYSEFYQRNQLNIDALQALENATALEPSVDVYDSMLNDFLINMRIIKMNE